MQYALDNLYNEEHIKDWYNVFYGADIDDKEKLYSFKDKIQEDLFIWGMIKHYKHNNIKWLKEFYKEDGFLFHKKEVINTEDKYLRLTDCSKDSFQGIIEKLR